MKKEVKDLYLCLLCPEGYVRGLREYYSKSSRVANSYAEAMFNRLEADNMNKFVNQKITIHGVKNRAVLIIDLDLCDHWRDKKEITKIITIINRLYDIKILGISRFSVKDLEEQFSHGYIGIFFKQIMSQNEKFSVKYIISSSNHYTYVYVGNPHVLMAAEEQDILCIPAYEAHNMLQLLRSEYSVE